MEEKNNKIHKICGNYGFMVNILFFGFFLITNQVREVSVLFCFPSPVSKIIFEPSPTNPRGC